MPSSVVWALLVLMTLGGALASLFLKKAAGSPGLGALLRCPWFYLGGGTYGVCALLNIIVLRYLDYSLVLPMTALTYVWGLVLAVVVLRERASWLKVAGVALILLGALALVAG